jgi:hypothetical protein
MQASRAWRQLEDLKELLAAKYLEKAVVKKQADEPGGKVLVLLQQSVVE